MKKHVTPRQRAERARRKAMGIALIQRPLRFVASKDSALVLQKDGSTRREFGFSYQAALDLAVKYHGAGLQHFARMFL